LDVGKQQGLKKDVEEWASRVELVTSDKKVAVCKIWGDSAPMSKRDSLYLLTWNLLSGIHHLVYWFVAIAKSRVCKCGCKGRCTFNELFRILAWSFRALLAGTHPHVDHNNKPFPPGSKRAKRAGTKLKVFGCCLAKNGDWDWLKQALGLCGWKGERFNRNICFRCPAVLHGGLLPAFDFSRHAGWRKALYTQAQFWARHLSISFVRDSRIHSSKHSHRLDALLLLGHFAIPIWYGVVGVVCGNGCIDFEQQQV